MLISTLLALIVALSQPASLPDLNGTWTMVPERSGSPTQSPPVTRMTFVIEQTAEQIHLAVTGSNDVTVSATYALGPAPKAPSEPLGAGHQRAYWDGNRLVVERGGTISGQTVSSKQILTLDPNQSEMIVERLVIVHHGYTLRGTPNYATVKDVFVRGRR